MQQVINAIVLGSVYCLFAIGLSMTWGTLNVLNLAHGAVFMFAAFTCYALTQRAGVGVPLALLVVIAMVIGVVLEVLIDVLIFRPIRRRCTTLGEAELAMLIASIGVASIPVTIAQRTTTDSPFSVTKGSGSTVHHITSGIYVTNIEIAIVIFTLVTTVALAVWLRRSRTGRRNHS